MASAPGCRACACDKQRPWYSTDAARIYLGMNPTGPSGAMFGEVMQVWEAMGALVEERDGKPMFEFPHVARVEIVYPA